MLKNARETKILCLTTMISFTAALFPYNLSAKTLTPLSFSQMYNLAQSGDVESLRASVRRGMNIDSTDTRGDTGLCIAARNRDSYTYNAFRAAGANPRHPCTQRIEDYENFINSSKAVPLQASAREAYSTMGKEHFEVSPVTWWVLGGLALGGGITALAMSGGGGGGGSSHEKEEYTYLGEKLGSASYSTTGQRSITAKVTVSNDGKKETIKKIADEVNFNESVLENADVLKVGLKAYDGGVYINSSGNEISTNSGTIGMAAINSSTIDNSGYLHTDSYNASILMLASNSSSAINNGQGIISGIGDNGLYLAFSGYKAADSVIGMYADSNSTITNNGDIQGSAIKASEDPVAALEEEENKENSDDSSSDDSSSDDSSSDEQDSDTEDTAASAGVGTIVGMEARIINTGANLSSQTIKAVNNGNIQLNGGGGTDTSTAENLSLVGMGSFLDDGFTNGSKNVNRAETSYLENNGTITLGYTGNYSGTDSSGDSGTSGTSSLLRKGDGGIVGMRADARTTAVNNGNIIINLTNSSSINNETETAAGIQSVHGGTIENGEDGSISIKTTSDNTRINYGMLSSEGNGTVSSLFSNVSQNIKNSGSISISASHSYGMASYNGGTLINSGNITLGVANSNSYYKNNVAMLGGGTSYEVALSNTGTIDIYSYESYAMENLYSGGTTITNDGTIHIHSTAKDSLPFAGNYVELINNGTIIYEAVNVKTENTGLTPPTEVLSVMSTSPTLSSSSSGSSSSNTGSGTQTIYNNGIITLDGVQNVSAMSAETDQGKVYNTGTINVGKTDIENNSTNIGMYLTGSFLSARLTNSGTINLYTNYSFGMVGTNTSTTSGLINDSTGVINIYGEQSFGIYAAGYNYVDNKGVINLYGNNNSAIYVKGGGEDQLENLISNSVIYIYGDNNSAFYLDGNVNIVKPGYVSICGGSNALCSATAEDTASYFYISGEANLGIEWSIQKGTMVKMADSGTLKITEDAVLSVFGENGKIVDGSAGGSVTVNEGATLTVTGSKSTALISGTGNSTINNGRINVSGTGAQGIRMKDSGTVTNDSGGYIIVSEEGAYGVYATDITGTLSNSGNIVVETDNSYGIYVNGTDSTGSITNSKVINVGGIKESTGETVTVGGSYGIYVNSNVTVTNTGEINVYGDGTTASYGIYSDKGNTLGEINNSGTITVSGTNSVGIYIENDTVTVNRGTINVTNGATASNKAGTETTTSSAIYARTGTLKNYGTIATDSILDFDVSSANGSAKIMINKNGTYSAAGLRGTVIAGADITQNSFADTYTNRNSFSGTDLGLKVISGSYMFDAETSANSDGNIDVIMTRKSFVDITADSSLSAFLENNYSTGNGLSYFDSLKDTADSSAYNSKLGSLFGFSVLPNFAAQNFETLRNLNREITDELFDTGNDEERSFVKTSYYSQETDSKHLQTGYDSDIYSIYGAADSKVNSTVRLGYGIAATRAEYDFDDGSSRYNNLLEVFLPVTYEKDNLKALVKPKAGFARGHYRRVSEDSVYKDDTKDFFYGADSEARIAYFSDIAALEPNIGFNLTAVHSGSLKEKAGLRVKSENTVSAQSVIGLDIKKNFEFNEEQSLLLTAGGKYFHEFGSRYRTEASADGMTGTYELKDERLQRDYGLLSLKAQYEHNNLALSAAVNLPLEQKKNIYYLFGLKYKF